MRPLRLEAEGFSAFRERVEIDFTDAEFFALVGPTGAGKSSVIDAMTFALYGSIPRLDRTKVAPVITQGSLEARVRFDFRVGEVEFTAVRVVRRTAQGATTKEARLERGGEVIAGDAEAVTAEVERLLGLAYDHFIRCVVLPQGEFSRFLHAKPSERQDLLVTLLDLGMYARMGQRARELAEFCSGKHVSLKQQLEALDYAADPDAIKDATARVTVIERALAQVEEALPALEKLIDEEDRARKAVIEAERRAELLATVKVPPHVAELSGAVRGAEGVRSHHVAAVAEAEAAVETAQAARAALPESGPLERAKEAHGELATIDGRIAKGKPLVDAAIAGEDAAAASLKEAEAALQAATDALEHARTEHRAHDLARALKTGDTCPVCRRVVEDLPAVEAPANLRKAEQTLEKARAARAKAEAAHRDAHSKRAQHEAALTALEEQRVGLAARVAEFPDPKAIEEQLKEIAKTDKALEAARAGERAARKSLGDADRMLDEARRLLSGAQRAFDAARDAVAALSPPPPTREDLAADWQALASWAAEQTGAVETAIAEANAAAAAADKARAEHIGNLERICGTASVALDGATPRDACVKALERARASLERIEIAREEVERITEELRSLMEEEQVARATANHLRANAFEKWVLDEAVELLLDGATEMLLQLSSGQYSLSFDKYGNFTVIDHRNANEVRSARTLSGGETFLASLALALALADRIAQLAARSAVRLESVFLDEGFGTLDPETLDTVGAAIENLAAGDRVVGIVTHVRDLAEKVPVRFEVRKGPSTSTVERVHV